MTEAGLIALLENIRGAARLNAMLRLAEHMDDAILLAASEFHEKQVTIERGLINDGRNSKIVRGSACRRVH